MEQYCCNQQVASDFSGKTGNLRPTALATYVAGKQRCSNTLGGIGAPLAWISFDLSFFIVLLKIGLQ